MKFYILCDKEGKPIIKKKYKVLLIDRGRLINGEGINDEFECDMVVFGTKKEMEKHIANGKRGKRV